MLGAACPTTGQSVGLLAPHLNTQTVNAFFEQFIKQVDPDVRVVMFWDQAGFHTSGELKTPKNLTLIPLPPACPELNPIENLWHHLRSHHRSNRAYADYDDLRHAAREAWQQTCLDVQTIKTVCHAPYLEQREVRA